MALAQQGKSLARDSAFFAVGVIVRRFAGRADVTIHEFHRRHRSQEKGDSPKIVLRIHKKAKQNRPAWPCGWIACEPVSRRGCPPWSFRPIRLGTGTPDHIRVGLPFTRITVQQWIPPITNFAGRLLVGLMLRKTRKEHKGSSRFCWKATCSTNSHCSG